MTNREEKFDLIMASVVVNGNGNVHVLSEPELSLVQLDLVSVLYATPIGQSHQYRETLRFNSP